MLSLWFSGPEIPTSLQVNRGKEFLQISWGSPATGIADSYKVVWTRAGSTSQTKTLTDTTYKIVNLTPDTQYTIDVIAMSNGIESAKVSVTQKTCE